MRRGRPRRNNRDVSAARVSNREGVRSNAGRTRPGGSHCRPPIFWRRRVRLPVIKHNTKYQSAWSYDAETPPYAATRRSVQPPSQALWRLSRLHQAPGSCPLPRTSLAGVPPVLLLGRQRGGDISLLEYWFRLILCESCSSFCCFFRFWPCRYDFLKILHQVPMLLGEVRTWRWDFEMLNN